MDNLEEKMQLKKEAEELKQISQRVADNIHKWVVGNELDKISTATRELTCQSALVWKIARNQGG